MSLLCNWVFSVFFKDLWFLLLSVAILYSNKLEEKVKTDYLCIPVMETSHSSRGCNTRNSPCDYVFIINFIKSDFP